MARRIKELWVSSWWMILVLVFCFAYFWRVSLVAKEAKIELDNYESAQFCQGANNCRQIFQAKVLESRTARSVQTLPSKYSSLNSQTVHNIVCKIRIKLSNSTELDATILTNLDLSKYQFDVPNVTLPIPAWNYDDISAQSFPVGAILHVEMWHGKPTFIYSKYINATSYSVETDVIFPSDTGLTDPSNLDILFDGSSTTGTSLTNPDALDTTGEYPVPTTDHPVLHYNLENTDVQGVFHFTIFLTVIFVAVQYLNTKYAD